MQSIPNMVRLTVALPSTARGAHDILEALQFIMASARFEEGCLGCSASTDADSVVHYVEEWAAEVDMRRRVRSDRFTSLLAIMESAKEPPEVKFDFVTMTRGLEYVAEVRGAAGEPPPRGGPAPIVGKRSQGQPR